MDFNPATTVTNFVVRGKVLVHVNFDNTLQSKLVDA